jgi:hypothetical protein
MFRHNTYHRQGALVFLAKISGKIICKTQYTSVLQIILPVILARKTSAP